MRIRAIAPAVVAGSAGFLVVRQNIRYLRARRDFVQDEQAQVAPKGAFHTVQYLKLAEGQSLIEAVRGLKAVTESAAGTKVVYAGQTILTAIESAQMEPIEWDAVIVVQHPSRDASDVLRDDPRCKEVLAGFDETYTHGFQRARALNLLVPVALLGIRFLDIVNRTRLDYPFVPADELARPQDEERLRAFEDVADEGKDAVVIFNLLKDGTTKERSANRTYGRRMASYFAWKTHGPMHIGRAVTLEGTADFNTVAIVYYPGVEYFRSLMSSAYFNRIVTGKQPGDTHAMPTVPLLGRL